jgi:molybdate transport system regulatory protein
MTRKLLDNVAATSDRTRAKGSLPGADQSAHAHIIAAQVKTKVWLELDGGFVIGDGGLRLLLGIVRHGSLAEAVRELGWSYRHAWGYLRQAEARLGVAVIRTRSGRGSARGMELTEAGHLLMERLRALRDRIDEALGPSGPTASEVAARGRRAARRETRSGAPR